MGKVSPKTLTRQSKESLESDVLTALERIVRQKNPQLLLTLLTESEHIMLARRIQIAKRLITGMSVENIRNDLRVGQATIESVERWLRNLFSEYRSVLPSLFEELQKRKKNNLPPPDPYSFRWLRKKYPLHFLLFNLLLDDVDWQKKN